MPVLNERDFTEAETRFLSLFFTGVEERSAVYCAKDTISSSLWAFLAGSYSRTTVTVREKFLQTQREVAGSDEAYLALISTAVESQSGLTGAIRKAESFLSKWAVDYGHDSLKDSAVDRFAVEVCSIRAAKVLERFNLGAYQEKSTRYVDFGTVEPMFHLIPDGGEELAVLHKDAMSLYNDMTQASADYFIGTLPGDMPANAAARTAKAKAFDVARYTLGAYLPTALGITMPSRETVRALCFFLGHKYPEIREIGTEMLKHVNLVNPALMTKVVSKPEHLVSLDTLSAVLGNDLGYEGAEFYENAGVTLVTTPADSLQHPRVLGPAMLASMVGFEAFDFARHVQAALASEDEAAISRVREIWREALSATGAHDEFPEALGAVFVHLAGTIDFGAYRDLQRHRRGYQQDVDTENADDPLYSYPHVDFDKLTGGAELRERYDDVMTRMEKLRLRLPAEQAAYALFLGHNVWFRYACSLQQLLYIIRLRTTPAGHESYRSFVQSLARTLIEAIPELDGLLAVDWSVNTDRSAAETRAEKKRQALQEGATSA